MIIGLLGMSKAGKDEFSLPYLNEGFKRYAFGDAVKNEYADLNSLPREEMFNYKKEFHRSGIIEHGEGKRKRNPFHWVDVLKKDLLLDHENGKNIIITDIRRIPELQFFKALKDSLKTEVLLYEIVRPIQNGGEFDTDLETSHALNYAHYYNLVDSLIYNNSSSEELWLVGHKLINNKYE